MSVYGGLHAAVFSANQENTSLPAKPKTFHFAPNQTLAVLIHLGKKQHILPGHFPHCYCS